MWSQWKARAVVITVLVCPVAAAAQAATPAAGGWRTPWSYDGAKGPDHWGALDPEYATCSAGHEQSPIDIATTTREALPAIHFDYKSGPVRLINNGYTAVRVNYPRGNGNVLIVGDTRYELTQFHFHHPSEEYVHGKPYAMAAHFMHASSDGKVVGVAVLLKAGRATRPCNASGSACRRPRERNMRSPGSTSIPARCCRATLATSPTPDRRRRRPARKASPGLC